MEATIMESIWGEKRRSERKGVEMKVKISLDTRSFDGYIYDVSREGLYLQIITDSSEILTDFISGTKFESKIKTNPVKEIALQCEIKREDISAESDVGIIYNLGAEITDSPAEYKDFVMTL
jgi:hypothetical protein